MYKHMNEENKKQSESFNQLKVSVTERNWKPFNMAAKSCSKYHNVLHYRLSIFEGGHQTQ